MKISKFFIINSVLFFVIPLVSGAQITSVEKGDKIRVTVPGELTVKRTGIVTEFSRDSLQFMYRDSLVNIPFAGLSRLEVSIGQKRSAGRGALIGAGSLGLTLGLIMLSTDETCSSDDVWCMDLFSRSDSFKLGLVSGALLGGASGAIIGHFIIRDRWKRIDISTDAVAFQFGIKAPTIRVNFQF